MPCVELKPNTKVVANGEPAIVVRVLSVTKVEVQLTDSKEIISIDTADLKVFPDQGRTIDEDNNDRCRIIPNSEDVDPAVALEARERFGVIKRRLAGEISTNEALAMINMKRTAFYELLKNFDDSIGPLSLLPNSRGRKKGSSMLPDEIEEIISTAIKEKFKGNSATYTWVWEEVRAKCSKLKIEIPAMNTVISRIKELGERELYRRKHGAEAAEQKFGAKTGKLDLSHALERVQMDHTLVDCILVDDVDRQPLFRPWVTLIVDLYTRVILGYYIAFHAPSALSVACAVTHAVFPKNRYLENLKCENIKHPYYGVPEILHMDNAKEFKSPAFQKACALNGITPEWRPPGKKHYGGHVERLIGTMMTSHVRFLPGATRSNIIERGDYDSEKNATLTIGEFTKWFAGQVEIYNLTEHRALNCSPDEMWARNFSSSSGEKTFPKLISDPFRFRLDFMPQKIRTIQKNGVELFKHFYWSPELKGFVGMKDVVIKYDPFSLQCVWARINGSYIQLRFSNLTLDDFTYEEYLIGKRRRSLGRSNEMNPQIIDIRDENESLVENSKKQTKKAKRWQKSREAYIDHTINQFSDKAEQSKAVRNKIDIDFSIAPTIYGSEEM